MVSQSAEDGKHTPLYDLHVALGARMVPFAGYSMPVQYPTGILKEHAHTREKASLFDVSHMGQVTLAGADPDAALESLVTGDLLGLADGRMRYTLLTNDAGGILDDLMVTRIGERLFVVVNAGRKEADIAHMQEAIGGRCDVQPMPHRALLALQGPDAEAVLARHAGECRDLVFLSGRGLTIDGVECFVTRSGYTGEDGYEISAPADTAERIARLLLDAPEVEPAGLGARDSLRLEAGLCLYGHDIDETTTPVEAALGWAVGKRRREEGGFPGHAAVMRHLAEGAPRKRVGIRPEGRAPAREHTEITDTDGAPIGSVTSGGFGPTVGGPVAMGYVTTKHASKDAPLMLNIRGKAVPARVAGLPFVAPGYHRG